MSAGHIAGALLFLVGIAGWTWILVLRAEALRTHSWPTTTGYIRGSRLLERLDADGPMYRAAISYDYHVQGREYHGRRVMVGDFLHTPLRQLVTSRVARYQAGQQVQVRYDPQRPHRAVLDPGWTTEFRMTGMLLVAVGALGTVIFVASSW